MSIALLAPLAILLATGLTMGLVHGATVHDVAGEAPRVVVASLVQAEVAANAGMAQKLGVALLRTASVGSFTWRNRVGSPQTRSGVAWPTTSSFAMI